jgi:hypothetical protein
MSQMPSFHTNVYRGTPQSAASLQINKYDHVQRVRQDLKRLGASTYGVRRFGSKYLPKIIHPDEYIGGIVYGFNEEGSVMLVATDRRVVFLNKKPLFFNEEEMTYDIVGGVSFGHAGLASTIILHTRMRDYKIKTLNEKCAFGFMKFVESRCLEHPGQSPYWQRPNLS